LGKPGSDHLDHLMIRRCTRLVLMPGGLLDNLGEQQLRDLFAISAFPGPSGELTL